MLSIWTILKKCHLVKRYPILFSFCETAVILVSVLAMTAARLSRLWYTEKAVSLFGSLQK